MTIQSPPRRCGGNGIGGNTIGNPAPLAAAKPAPHRLPAPAASQKPHADQPDLGLEGVIGSYGCEF